MMLDEKALQLLTISEGIRDAVERNDTTSFKRLVLEFVRSKKELRTLLGPEGGPIVNLPGAAAERARKVLNDIARQAPLDIEVFFAEAGLSDLLDDKLTLNETDDIGHDVFYSWFSHHEYVEGLYEIGSLILAAGALPANLSTFVQEARHCYAFQQYSAVFALSRTILEIALRDLCLKHGVLEQDQGNIKQLKTRFLSLYDMVTDICAKVPAFAVLQEELNGIRAKSNYIVHGNRPVTGKEAKSILHDALHAVHRLYEIDSRMSAEKA